MNILLGFAAVAIAIFVIVGVMEKRNSIWREVRHSFGVNLDWPRSCPEFTGVFLAVADGKAKMLLNHMNFYLKEDGIYLDAWPKLWLKAVFIPWAQIKGAHPLNNRYYRVIIKNVGKDIALNKGLVESDKFLKT